MRTGIPRGAARAAAAALCLLLGAAAALAADPAPAPATTQAAPSKETREKMAAVHEQMAACLRSEKTFAECRTEMMQQCRATMGSQGCTMMGFGMGRGMGMGMGRRMAPPASAPAQ